MSGGFLSRWSRLKRGEAQEPVPVAPPEPAAPEAEAEAEEAFDLSLLPDIASLTAESDITLFLHKAVPEALRHAALRRMWVLDPMIRDFIGPVDYAWDFNAPEGIPGIAERLTGAVDELLAQAVGAPAPAPAPVAPEPPPAEAETAPPESPPAMVLAEADLAPAPDPLVLKRHGSAMPT
jgi:hypothetical protein